MTKQSVTGRAVREYLAHGWAPTPVEAWGKSPLLVGWPHRRLSSNDLPLFEGQNVGLLLGDASGGLIDVDCDWPEAAQLAHELLPPTNLVHGRPGSPQSHWWYCSPGAPNRVFRVQPGAADKRTVVELRGNGLMTVVPPSVHPVGERLGWERWGPPALVQADELRGAVARLALAAVLCRLGWTTEDALRVVRRSPVDLAHVLQHVAPVRDWLGLDGELRRGAGRLTMGGELVLGRASPRTGAVLLRLGGVVGAARLVGLSLREGRQPCPFHGGESGRALQVTKHAWQCWSGCGQGNSIHLVARVLGVSYREARDWLEGELGLRSRHHPSPARR